jgi:hypothetical protein
MVLGSKKSIQIINATELEREQRFFTYFDGQGSVEYGNRDLQLEFRLAM